MDDNPIEGKNPLSKIEEWRKRIVELKNAAKEGKDTFEYLSSLISGFDDDDDGDDDDG